jgi:hypothetical protein
MKFQDTKVFQLFRRLPAGPYFEGTRGGTRESLVCTLTLLWVRDSQATLSWGYGYTGVRWPPPEYSQPREGVLPLYKGFHGHSPLPLYKGRTSHNPYRKVTLMQWKRGRPCICDAQAKEPCSHAIQGDALCILTSQGRERIRKIKEHFSVSSFSFCKKKNESFFYSLFAP